MRHWFRSSNTPEPSEAVAKDGCVNSRADIRHLLIRTFENHCLLSVRIADDHEIYSSALVELGKLRRYVTLDALTPAEGNARMAVRSAIAISTQLDNLDMSFTTSVKKVGCTVDLPYYRIAIPRQIHYAQHRREHRVPIPMNFSTTVSIWLDQATRVSGTVRDLSVSGFCAQLD